MIHKEYLIIPRLILPGHLSGPYWLLADQNDPDINEVIDLIAYASPHAVCLGCGEEPAEEGTLVLYRPDALIQTGRLLKKGIDPKRISFMPLTTEYPGAPLVMWKNFKDRPDLRKALSSREAHNYLVTESWPHLADTYKYWAAAYQPYINNHQPLFDKVLNGLYDDRSRRIFDMILRQEPFELWQHSVDTLCTTTEYLSRAIPFAGDTILNLGIFSGPELPYFMTLVGENGVVHNIDPFGHDKFDDYVRDFVATCPGRAREARIAAGQISEELSLRVWDDGQLRRFNTGSLPGVVVPSLALDEYVEREHIKSVDFIKIDIEGMEIEALIGMSKTIKQCRPILAVAIYHEPEHLWRIPVMLMEGLNDYDFYIDHFSPTWTETVLTAVPRELRGITHGLNDASAHRDNPVRMSAT